MCMCKFQMNRVVDTQVSDFVLQELSLLIPVVTLTLLLLNTTCPVLANSVDQDQLASEELKKPTDLDLHCLSLNM